MSRKITVSAIGMRSLAATAQLPSSTVALVENHLRDQIAQVVPDGPDLIVLPELCDIPVNQAFLDRDWLQSYLTERSDRILNLLASLARQHQCYITYPTLLCASDGMLRNTILLLDRTGVLMGTYDKCHPTLWELDAGVVPGTEVYVAHCDFGRVGFAICFDLNFNSLCARYAQTRLDIVAFCSMYHGGLMQAYWAYACRAHFIGAIAGLGGFVLSPVGERIASSTNYFNYISTSINLDSAVVHLDYNWDRLRAMREKYGSAVRVFDPGFLGSVLISSESDAFTINDVMAEYEIEALDDYLRRALQRQGDKRLSLSSNPSFDSARNARGN
jgi:predicted amidohydrolase